MKLMIIVLTTTTLQVPGAAEPLWKQMATFGIVGAICAWLLMERWLIAGKERASRESLANAIQTNTLATQTLATKIEDMNRAIWQFVMYGKVRMAPPPGEQTPPHLHKTPGGQG